MVPSKPQLMTIQEVHEHLFHIYTSSFVSNVSPEVAKTQALYNHSLSKYVLYSKSITIQIDSLFLNYHKIRNVIHTLADTATPSKFLSE